MSAACEYALAGGGSPEALVERHAPLVKRIAVHLLGRLPTGIELDDLIQVGLIALLEAARQYRPAKGASFETYAAIRIRGAMLDEVRRNDWAPRSVYKKQRQISAAIQAIENRTRKPAQAPDIAEELGVSLDEYFAMLAAASAARMFSLDQGEGGSEPEMERQADPGTSPVQDLESAEFQAAMAAAIAKLPEREALVMALYYDEERNLKEIGEVLGVSESRVCQIHAQALTRLRARLQEWSAPGRHESIGRRNGTAPTGQEIHP
ncbi:MAG: RNA polymerase sigma factor FliA [Chromatiales bacterium]|nr:MAG: RNA polymerase sigma factor FliA [Chromatiales bacterium]